MELVVFDDGLVFVIVFLQIVKPSHELFLIIGDNHFLVLDSFRTDLIVHDIVDVCEGVDTLGVEVLVIECVIDEDRH